MMALDLKVFILLGLLVLAASGLAAVILDRRYFRDPLLARTGAQASALNQLLETAPFGLILIDLEFRCFYTNAYSRRLLGLETNSGKLPTASWYEQLQNDLLAARQSHVAQAPYRVLTLPSELSLSWWICPLPNFSLVLLTDLSRQHKLERASRIFVGSLSHELRTPLTSILAHLEVLRTSDMPETARENSLHLIHQETNRVVRLVRDLIELNRLESTLDLALKPVDLLLIAEAAIAGIILEAETRQISISLEADSSLPRVLGDPDRLKQVFLNLLDNAVKYCRPNDRIEVFLRKHSEGVDSIIKDLCKNNFRFLKGETEKRVKSGIQIIFCK